MKISALVRDVLHLNDTRVRDLTPLAGLKNLGQLTIVGTQVSDDELQSLQKALQNCNIVR